MAGDFPNLSVSIISEWPKANINDPVTRGWYPPFAVVLTSLSTAILIARVCSQIRKSSTGLGVDDLFAGLALVFAMVYTIASIFGTMVFGFNRHMWDVPARDYSHAALVQWLSEGAFILSACFSKISILFFYRRLDHPYTDAFRRVIYAFIAFTGAYSFACLLSQTLLCRPTSSYWRIPSKTNPVQRSCSSQDVYYPLQGSVDSFSTFYCIMIPVLVLRNIPMSQFQRNGLRAVSIAGLGVLGVSIARAVYISHLAYSTNGDSTWNGFNVFVCSQIECQLLLICASAPFLQRFTSHYPTIPIIHVYQNSDGRNDSVMSRVSSSLSGQIKRLPFGRSHSPRNMDISRPRPPAVMIPEWEFDALQLPRPVRSPLNEQNYDRYLAGMYGPPAPPKDIRKVFDQYRHERHGEIV